MTDKLIAPASYTVSASTAAAGWWTLNEWALIIGIVASIGTFVVNWYFKLKNYKLNLKNSKQDID